MTAAWAEKLACPSTKVQWAQWVRASEDAGSLVGGGEGPVWPWWIQGGRK